MNRQQLIMQLGEYCNYTKCQGCPVYEAWTASFGGNFQKSCMEYLRFPEIAKKMDEAVKKGKRRTEEA